MTEATTPVTPDPNAAIVNPQITDSVTTPPPEAKPGETTPSDELILGKFKTVDDLKKSYSELETKLHGKAPKEYAFDAVEGEDFKLNRDDPILKEFSDVAKAAHLSQAQVEAVLSIYKKELLSKVVNPADEIKKLGHDGAEQVATVKNWLSNHLSAKSFEAILPAINSSSFVIALQELKGKLQQQKVPGAPPGGHSFAGMTPEAKQSWVADNWEKIKSGDPLARKQFDDLYKE